MNVVEGNIWGLGQNDWIGVTTNQGWKQTSDGNVVAVMGRGIALDCAKRYPDVAAQYGVFCKQWYERTGNGAPVYVFPHHKLLMLPTKELNRDNPSMSWQRDSSSTLIVETLRQIAFLIDIGVVRGHLYLPLLGAGNGNIKPERSLEIMMGSFLRGHENVTIVKKIPDITLPK